MVAGGVVHVAMSALATCLLNPKAYIFMLAVFPQFIRPDLGSLAAQAVALGHWPDVCAARFSGGGPQRAGLLALPGTRTPLFQKKTYGLTIHSVRA